MTHSDQRFDKLLLAVQLSRCLGDDVLALVDGREVLDIIGNLAFCHLAIGAFQETVRIGAGIYRQRVDQADIRAFRRLNRTDTTVVGRVYVANLKTGTLAGQSTRAKRRHTALVRHFR